MHTTKSQILALLKRSRGATVDGLATATGLATMTVRQHLTALERDSLVTANEVRRPTGRPHYHYTLTDDGHRELSHGYDRMLLLLIEAAVTLDPEQMRGSPAERRARLFEVAARSLGEKHRSEVSALTGRPRADRMVEILRAHGGFPEWHESGDGFELRDFTCAFRESVPEGRCVWHETLLSAMIDAPVRAVSSDDSCTACCRYVIETSERPLPHGDGS